MITLLMKINISQSKLLLGFVGVSATIGAFYYFTHQNQSKKPLESDNEISIRVNEKDFRSNSDKVGSKIKILKLFRRLVNHMLKMIFKK